MGNRDLLSEQEMTMKQDRGVRRSLTAAAQGFGHAIDEEVGLHSKLIDKIDDGAAKAQDGLQAETTHAERCREAGCAGTTAG